MAEEKEVTGKAFGFLTPLQEKEIQEEFADEEPSPPTPEEVTETPTPVAPVEAPEAEASAPATDDSKAPPVKVEETPAETLLFGKWKSEDDLYESYRNIQAADQRNRDRAAAAELQAQQAQGKAQELEQMLQEVALRLQADQGSSQAHEQLQQMQAQVAQQAQARQQAQAQQEQQARAVQIQEVTKEIDDFRVAYPDSKNVEDSMAAIILDFQKDDEGALINELFPVNRENLEVAYVLAKNPVLKKEVLDLDLIPTEENLLLAKEAVENPELGKVLRANPQVLQRDDNVGIDWARQQAALPSIVTRATDATDRAQEKRKQAYVETGGTGAPVAQPPGSRPADPMDEAISYWSNKSKNVFGI